MQKQVKVVIALLALAFVSSQPAHAGVGLGFDIMGNFYQPRDSRFQGMGTNVGINFKIDDKLTLGYRVEEMNVKGEEAVGGATLTGNAQMTSQGIDAFYQVFNADENKFAGALGLWLGSASLPTGLGTVGAQTSPFIEPLVKVAYTSGGKVETSVKFGVGYRFVRNFTAANAFAGGARLKDFDGLDITFGVGLAF
ncbi:MAG: hypothetical protein HY922_16730 [Elusimicrobia bacterium]|nr:hypothetical protein [Elusimicrobiota bacterium]